MEQEVDGMSSVLINGMEMPKNCGNCHLRKSNEDRVWCPILGEYICFETEFLGRKTNCPLVEVPTPHGRLVDGDVLMTEVMDSDLDHLQRDDWKEVIQIVQDAPTIIEAEGSENEDNNV